MNALRSMIDRQEAVYHHICKGRMPFATVDMQGDSHHPNLFGQIEFYATPAGTLILAELQGLPRPSGTCRRSASYEIVSKGVSDAEDTYGCPYLPTLYEKEGSAWCSIVTAKLRVTDLKEKRIVLLKKIEGKAHLQPPFFEIAAGTVRFAQSSNQMRSYLDSSAVVS